MSSVPNPSIDLDKLRLFVQVAELGSLTKVAIANESIQSAVSRQVAALERHCGGRLFQRTGRGVILSEFGELILPRVKALLAEADQLSNDMKSSAGVPTGEVRIALVPSLAQPLVDMLLRQVRERFPEIRLRCSDASSGRIDEWIGNGTIDIGIPFRYGRVPTSEQPLATVDTYLVGPPGDRLTAAETVDFMRLDNLPMVLPGPPNGLRFALDHLSKRYKIHLNVAMEADSLTIQKDLPAAGTLHTILSGHAVMREARAGMLQASRIVNPGLERTITIVTTTQRPLSLAAREVAKTVRNIIEEISVTGRWGPAAAQA